MNIQNNTFQKIYLYLHHISSRSEKISWVIEYIENLLFMNIIFDLV